MGVIRGLKGINENEKKQAERREAAANKVTWFKILDGQSFRIRFLQELDEDSPGYNSSNGIGFVAVEHSNPDNYMAKALCSFDDQGACYGCEQSRAGVKGWKQKNRLYINVLVDNGKDDPFVAVLSQGMSNKSITPSLLSHLEDSNSITDRWWRIKRSGSTATDTAYVASPVMQALDDKDPAADSFTLFDLDKAVRDVPYDEQEVFYGGSPRLAEDKPARSAPASDEW